MDSTNIQRHLTHIPVEQNLEKRDKYYMDVFDYPAMEGILKQYIQNGYHITHFSQVGMSYSFILESD